MKNAILIHGWAQKDEFYDPAWPTPSNSHWLPWLSKQLMVRDIHTVAVEMPKTYYPIYEDWKREFERYDIKPETLLVGHSCGAGFLVRWLSEQSDIKVGKVVLVAPWMGFDPDQEFDASFFDFKLDEALTSKTADLVIFNSIDDVEEIQKSTKLLIGKVKGIRYREFSGKGHFTLKYMKTEEFPELIEELVT